MKTPTVLIHTQEGVTNYEVDQDDEVSEVKVVLFNWDHLADPATTRGDLCKVWKEIWRLPESMREVAMGCLIRLVEARFAITALFIPQRWKNDAVIADGQPVRFDVTEQLLRRGPDYVDNLRDRSYPTDDLAENLYDRLTHPGPFDIEVKDDAMEFLYADENEAGAAELQDSLQEPE
jgi:hypothetical protein